MGTADPVDAMLDELIERIQATSKACILARTCHELGSGIVGTLADGTLVTATVGLNLTIEPIPVAELRSFNAVYADFVSDSFHGRLLLDWQQLLSEVFAHYVGLHLSGSRTFTELGNTQLKIDFAEPASFQDQVRRSLCRDFEFRRYADRQKLIARLRDPAGLAQDDAETVLCHIHIRNAIQHRHGILDEYAFKELGRNQIDVLDEAGATRSVRAGDRVVVSFPEFDKLRRALLAIGQKWRTP